MFFFLQESGMIFRMKGLIALDIDGTLTTELTSLPDQVVAYLGYLVADGWRIALITGRTFSFASSLLHQIDFPYLLAVQNGSDIMEMPSKKLLHRCYLPGALIPALDKAYAGQKEDFIIYSGFETGDFCYFRPKRFSPALYSYLETLQALTPTAWKPLEDFDSIKTGHFPLIKCFGEEQAMHTLTPQLRAVKGVASSLIHDPVDPRLYLQLVTSDLATKGRALSFFKKLLSPRVVIAAGDDRNDLPMLKEAQIRIAMADSPEELLAEATMIARPASEMGIIDALEDACHH